MNNLDYISRGIHNTRFLTSLISGNLKEMLKVVNQDPELDVQIRRDYLNIYYMGGSIAKILSEKSIEFDIFYFYTNHANKPKKEIEKDPKIVNGLKNKSKLLIEKFKQGKYDVFFSKAKEIMDKWFTINPKEERLFQHNLVINNAFNKSDYTIVDIEYQVSDKSEFVYTNLFTHNKKKPRFDIIAINKNKQLCVIELKKGINALIGKSGLLSHWDSYLYSIGRNPTPFIEEMILLVKQKKEFNLIDKHLNEEIKEVQFIFAYAYDLNSTDEQDKVFENEYKKIKENIKVLKLNNSEFRLLN